MPDDYKAPLPAPTPESKPFWDAAKRHELRIQRCRPCQQAYFYPRNVCPQCLSILDAKDPNLRVLQKFKDKMRVTLQIPLGSRGKWRGAEYEVIGYQLRSTKADGATYSWSEYLLFNPYQGFRYLSEYGGHWNDIRTLRRLPFMSTRPSTLTRPHSGKRWRRCSRRCSLRPAPRGSSSSSRAKR